MRKLLISGKEYPCRTTMGAFLRFKQETGRDVSQMAQDDLADLVTFMWCCVKSACAVDGVEFGMTLMEFADALDLSDTEAFSRSLEVEDPQAQKKTL